VLVEVLAAAAVVALGLTALVTAIPVAAVAVSEGGQLSTATFLASARLEQVRSAVWSERPVVDLLGVSTDAVTPPQSAGLPSFPDEPSLAPLYGSFSRQVRIRDCGAPPGCGGVVSSRLRQITVRVAYRPMTATGVASTDKTVSLTTLVSKR
jgi:hypothetical protein